MTYLPSEIADIVQPIKTEQGYMVSEELNSMIAARDKTEGFKLESITLPGVYYDYESGEFKVAKPGTPEFKTKQISSSYIDIT